MRRVCRVGRVGRRQDERVRRFREPQLARRRLRIARVSLSVLVVIDERRDRVLAGVFARVAELLGAARVRGPFGRGARVGAGDGEEHGSVCRRFPAFEAGDSRQAVLDIDDVRGRSRRHRERRRGWGWGFGPCLGRRVAGLAVVQGAVFVGVGEGGDRFGARDDAAVGAVRLAVFVAHHKAVAKDRLLAATNKEIKVEVAGEADQHAFDRGAGVGDRRGQRVGRAHRVFSGLWRECDRGLVRKPAPGGRVFWLARVLFMVFVRVDEGRDRVETAVFARVAERHVAVGVGGQRFAVRVGARDREDDRLKSGRAGVVGCLRAHANLGADDVDIALRRQRDFRRGRGAPCLGRRVAGLAVVQGAVFVGVGEGGDRFGARDDAAVGAVRLAVFVAHHKAVAKDRLLAATNKEIKVEVAGEADQHAFDRGAGVGDRRGQRVGRAHRVFSGAGPEGEPVWQRLRRSREGKQAERRHQHRAPDLERPSI